MRAHAPTLAVFSVLSLAVVAGSAITGTRAAPRQDSIAATGAITGLAEVTDGDGLKLNGLRIRLHGIDAPEMTQTCRASTFTGGFKGPVSDTWRCGLDARRALHALIGKVEVSCVPITLDKYGRTVARCRAGQTDLNAEMVRQGFAWAFVRYATDYVEIEKEARAARRGIWQGEAQPAWDFRAAKWQAAEVAAPAGCTIKGNVTAKGEHIYHMPWSPWYERVRMDQAATQRQGKRWFCSEGEAIAAGWRPSAAK